MIIEKRGDDHTLRNMITNKSKHAHTKTMITYRVHEDHISPEEAALADFENLHIIEYIIKEYKGNDKKGKLSDLLFLVHWVGEVEDTWEPWGNLRGTIQFKNFLESHQRKFYKKLAKRLKIEENTDMMEEDVADDT